MSVELKPCPFCGSPGVLEGGDFIGGWNEKTGPRPYRVECSRLSCIASQMIGNDWETEEEAIEAWNRRANDEIAEQEPPRIEVWTECDTCAGLERCKRNWAVIDITGGTDKFKHYTAGLNGCPEE